MNKAVAFLTLIKDCRFLIAEMPITELANYDFFGVKLCLYVAGDTKAIAF